MFNISDYLKKFSRIEGDSLAQREVISTALKSICGIEGAQFELKKGVLTVKGPAAMKSTIFMRKVGLMESINSRLTRGRVIDVR